MHGARILCLGCSSMFGTETDHWTAKKTVEERLEEKCALCLCGICALCSACYAACNVHREMLAIHIMQHVHCAVCSLQCSL